MNRKQEFEIEFKIVERAQSMGVGIGDRMCQLMDIDHAHQQFGLRLEDWLNADDFNFAHDFCGIQRHIDRETGLIGDFFIPRFARKECVCNG